MAEESTKPKKINRDLVKTIVIFVCIFAVIIGCLTSYLGHDERTASNPVLIAHHAGFKLPDYDVISQDDNMDSNSSEWGKYVWQIKTKQPLTAEHIKRLTKLASKDARWTYNAEKNEYVYHDYDEDDLDVAVTVSAADGVIDLSYSWCGVFD